MEAAGAVRSEGVDEFEPVYSPVVARRASKSVQDVSKMRDLDETDSLTTESEDGHPLPDGHLKLLVRFAVVNLRRVFGPVVADVIKEHFGRRRVPPSRVRGDGGCASPATRRVRAGGMVLYGSMGEGARGGAPTSSPEVGVRQGDAIAHDGRQGLSEGVRTIP